MLRATHVFALLCASILLACGSASSPRNDGDSTLNVAFRGSLRPMPFPKSETTPSFTNLRMQLFDSAFIWNDKVGGAKPDTPSLYNQSVPQALDACASSGCDFYIPDQDIGNARFNLVALIAGDTDASRSVWAPVYTNIVNEDSLLFARQQHALLNATAPAYAISRYGLGQLASQLSLPNAEALLARGLVIGLLRGKDAIDYSGGLPEGVAGGRIRLSEEQAALVDVRYPDDAYTTATNGSTNADGAFYLVGKAAGTRLGVQSLSITASQASFVWTNRSIAMIYGSVTVAPMSAMR